MELRAWAERVLFGETLAEKLLSPGLPTDGAPGAPLEVPAAPGRPVGLAFREERAPFPGAHELHRADARAAALHFFANHELLALELFALALLRFPDAPPAFRRGVLGIATEEQRHLAAYVRRLEALGAQLGDLPLNRFFWSALAGAGRLEGLVAGLTLTFEQANLDHAGWWAGAFRSVGDGETADVLDAVLADEIGHVRHGVAWFERWRPPGGSWWEAWVELLPPPLTPARAKGPGFSRSARRAAGIPDDVIERVAVFGASKGRPPVVHSFEPGVEAALAGEAAGAVGRVAADLATLPMYLAATGDLVLVPRAPSLPWLTSVAAAGFPIPEWGVGPPAEVLHGRTVGGYAPWAVSPAYAAWSGATWEERWARLYRKDVAAGWAAEIATEAERADLGRVCRSEAEIDAALGAIPEAVIKAPLGTAGRGMRRARAPEVRRWAEEVLRRQGAVVVEPWRDRVADLSVQLDVAPDGSATVHPPGRFLTDDRGGYRGAVLGRPLTGFSTELLRFYHGGGGVPVPDRLAEVARAVGRRLASVGYAGPAGVDALIHRVPGGFRLRPLVEVNPRVTMGRVAQAMARRIAGGRVGWWLHLPIPRLARAGVRDVPAWAAEVCGRLPVVLRWARPADPPLLERGAVFTTDPGSATLLVTLLVVGRADELGGLAEVLPPELIPPLA